MGIYAGFAVDISDSLFLLAREDEYSYATGLVHQVNAWIESTERDSYYPHSVTGCRRLAFGSRFRLVGGTRAFAALKQAPKHVRSATVTALDFDRHSDVRRTHLDDVVVSETVDRLLNDVDNSLP